MSVRVAYARRARRPANAAAPPIWRAEAAPVAAGAVGEEPAGELVVPYVAVVNEDEIGRVATPVPVDAIVELPPGTGYGAGVVGTTVV